MNDTTDVQLCPSCNTAGPVPLSGGRVLCMECRTEWTPGEASATFPVPEENGADVTAGAHVDDTPRHLAPVLTAPETLDDVLGPPDPPGDVWVDPAADVEVIGTRVVLEGGQVATIVALVDDDTCRVRLGDGREEQVSWNVIERAILDRDDHGDAVIDVSDDDARALGGTYLAIASLALGAGAATVVDGDDGRVLGVTPSGWLPDDPGTVAVIEQGVGYAIAFLVIAYGIDVNELCTVAAGLLESTTETMEGQ